MDGTTAGNLGSVFPGQPQTAPIGGTFLNGSVAAPALQIPSLPNFSSTTAPIVNSLSPEPTTPSITSPTDYEAMENNIQDLDFDQMVWSKEPVSTMTAAPVPALVPEPIAQPLAAPVAPTPAFVPAPTPAPSLFMPRQAMPSVPPRPVVMTAPMPVTPVAPLMPVEAVVVPTVAELEPTPIVPIPPTPEPMPVAISIPEPTPIVTPEPEQVVTPEPVKKEEVKNFFAAPIEEAPVASMGSSKSGGLAINRRLVTIVAVVLVVGLGGFFGVNAVVHAQKSHTAATAQSTSTTAVTQPVAQAAADTTTDTPTDTTTTAPSDTNTNDAPATTTAPSDSNSTVPSVANTAVSDDFASLPGFLDIAKLGIHASVEQVSTTTSGAMGAPTSIWDAGWYTGSSRPGETGVTFIDGHSSSAGGALFGKLDTLVVGDTIKVERNDGIAITYSVAKVSVVNRNDVNMASMLKPYNVWKNGLNLMSCEGAWVASENTLENRVLVYAVQT
jgi:LPXTG-site transpeptidase (sortase) family protein